MNSLHIYFVAIRSLCICVFTLAQCSFSAETTNEGPSNDQLLMVKREMELFKSMTMGDYGVTNDSQGNWYVCQIIAGGADTSPKPYIDGATGAIVQPPGSIPIGQSLKAGQIKVLESFPGSPGGEGWSFRWIVAPTVGHENQNNEHIFLLTGAECALVQISKSAPSVITLPLDIVHVRPFPKEWAKDIVPGITYRRLNRGKFEGEVAFKELIGNENHIIKIAAIQATAKAHRVSVDSWEMTIRQNSNKYIIAMATHSLLNDCPASQYDDLRARIHRLMTPETAPGVLLGATSVAFTPKTTASQTKSQKEYIPLLSFTADEAEKSSPKNTMIQAFVYTIRDWIAGQKTLDSEEKK